MLCLSGFELHSRWVPLLKTKVYTATRPAADSQKGGLRPLSVRLQELLTV